MKIGRLNRIKNEIIHKMAGSQDLLKLLYYVDCDVDVYEKDDLTDDEIMKVMSENIYKRRRVPMHESNEMKTYLSISHVRTTPTRGNEMYWKDCMVSLCVITNQELDGIPQGSRLDEIDDAITNVFQGQNIKAFKDCYIAESIELQCPEPYVGKAITLRFVDTNDKAMGKIHG